MKKLILIQTLLVLSFPAFSQSVGLGTTTPNASSALEIQSTSKGLLIPRLTTAQRNAIASPANGLIILNLDDKCIDIYDGANWIKNCGMKITGMDTLPGEWNQKANVGGGPRSGAVAFSIGSKGYMGTGSNGPMKKDFWEFDPATNIWTQKADFGGTARSVAVGFAAYGWGYIGLGFDTGGNHPSDFWQYNPSTNTWTQKNNFPGFGREKAIGFVQGSYVYVGTGIRFNSDSWYKDIWEYYPPGDSWFQMNDFPFPAHSLAAFSIGSYGYVGIGWHKGALPPLFNHYLDNSFYEFNNAGFGTWTQVTSFPGSVRHSTVSFILNDIGYVGTGAAYAGALYQDFWGYNASGNTWQQKPNFAGSPRNHAAAFVIGNKAYVGTGYDGATKEDFYEYDPVPQGPVYNNTQPTEDVYSINDGTWTKSINNVYNSNSGNIGIGTSNPTSKLEVAGTFKLSGTFVSPLIADNTTANKKLVLYNVAANDHEFYGFGINGNTLRYQTSVGAKHSFYAATSSSASVELMHIQGDGNIAMGAITAQNKLDIQANVARTGTHATGRPLYVTGSILEASNGIEFRHDNGTQGIGFGFSTIYATGSNVDQNLGLAARGSAGALLFKTNNIERMRVNGAGNVGIGTISPNAQLQFANTIQNRKLVLWETANNDHEFYGFGINGSTLRYQVSYPGDSHVFFAGTGPGSSSELMRIVGNGNMGIINSGPTERLHIGSFGNSANTYMEISTTGGNQFKAGIKLKHYSEGYGWTLESDETTAQFHIRRHVNNTTGSNALSIDGYNGNISLEGIIQSEAFIAPDLFNGFTNYGGAHATGAYYKDKMGRVHLRGLITKTTSHAGLFIFTLPAGYSPSTSGRLIFTALAESGISRIDIYPDGNVQIISGSTGWISLDGISFRAD